MKAKNKIQVYRPKSLIDGASIGQVKGRQYVAVPDKFSGRKIFVRYGGVTMIIRNWKEEALLFRRFRDKYWTAEGNRPQYYTLGYFEFIPDSKTY